jgi:small GTP-binding protein
MSTIGLAFAHKELTLQNKEKVKLKLVDTGGQERYKSLAKNYYKNADGVLFVFAHNDKDSFDHIIDWIELFDQNTTNKEIPKFLIGNKNDLKKFNEQESFDDFIKQHNILRYISTSAKDNKKNNISEIFKDMSEIINKTYKTSDKQYKLGKDDKNKNKAAKKCCGSDYLDSAR